MYIYHHIIFYAGKNTFIFDSGLFFVEFILVLLKLKDTYKAYVNPAKDLLKYDLRGPTLWMLCGGREWNIILKHMK